MFKTFSCFYLFLLSVLCRKSSLNYAAVKGKKKSVKFDSFIPERKAVNFLYYYREHTMSFGVQYFLINVSLKVTICPHRSLAEVWETVFLQNTIPAVRSDLD